MKKETKTLSGQARNDGKVKPNNYGIKFFLIYLTFILLLAACSEFEAKNFDTFEELQEKERLAALSSSDAAIKNSSSSGEVLSSSQDELSSSSGGENEVSSSSSETIIESSSSIEQSSSSVPSSSSEIPESSSSTTSTSSSCTKDKALENTNTYCYNGILQDYGLMEDTRGQNWTTYHTVTIGSQIWMADNLAYEVDGSKCYEETDAGRVEIFYCNSYGRLYDWATAMALDTSCNSSSCTSSIKTPHQGICPDGWHIPTIDEWKTLYTLSNDEDLFDAFMNKGKYTLKQARSPLGGYYNSNNSTFDSRGVEARWWSSTEATTSNLDIFASFKKFTSECTSVDTSETSILKTYGYSVRCVKDNTTNE